MAVSLEITTVPDLTSCSLRCPYLLVTVLVMVLESEPSGSKVEIEVVNMNVAHISFYGRLKSDELTSPNFQCTLVRFAKMEVLSRLAKAEDCS